MFASPAQIFKAVRLATLQQFVWIANQATTLALISAIFVPPWPHALPVPAPQFAPNASQASISIQILAYYASLQLLDAHCAHLRLTAFNAKEDSTWTRQPINARCVWISGAKYAFKVILTNVFPAIQDTIQ